MSELKRYDVQVEVAFPHGVCWSASRLHSVDGEHVDADDALREIATRDARIAELEHQLEVQSMLARANQRDLSAEQSAGRDLFVRLRELEAERDEARKALRELAEDIAEAIANDEHERVGAIFQERTHCEDCLRFPASPVELCPYHAAKRLLGGDGG